jgi:hypothetical protein
LVIGRGKRKDPTQRLLDPKVGVLRHFMKVADIAEGEL